MPGFRRLFRRRDVDRDVDDELKFHVDMKARDLEDEPLSTADARNEALSRFGDFEEVRGQCLTIQSSMARRRSRRNFLDASLQDLRFAVRTLGRSPGFTTMAVLTLALGIGGNTAIFSVMNSVVLRPLPYPAPDRLVQMVESNPELAAEQGWPAANTPVSLQNYRDYRELNTVFDEIGWANWAGNPSGVNLAGGNRPQRIKAVSTSASLLPTLGIKPLLGRGWLPAEEEFTFDGPRVAILSHGLWISQFGADPTVLGRSITVDEWPHTIVGVMPPHFEIPSLEFQGALHSNLSGADLYVPLDRDGFRSNRGSRQVQVIARLREGVRVERALEEMNTLAASLSDTYPDANRGWSIRLIPLRDLLTRSVGLQIALVMVAVGFVLLIGCTNVANLLLARGVARSPEIAVRAALGGGRTRIVRQLLTESLVLASAAGGIGLLLAYAGNRALVSLIPAGLPRAGDTGVDGTVLAFTTLLTLGTGVVFGLVPALQGSRTDLATAMKGGTNQATGSRRGAGMSRILVTSEVALALILLVGAGLFARNFARLAGADLGYEPGNLLKVGLDVGRPNPYNTKYFTCDPDSDAVAPRARCPRNTNELERFYDQVVERVERVPGVRSATLIDIAPLRGAGAYPLRIPASSDPDAPSNPTPGNDTGGQEAAVPLGNTGGSIVHPGYFRTMGLRILVGRDFRSGDASWWSGVAVVNERMARRVWPGENPLGKRITFYGNGDWMTVIGVVEDAQHSNLSERVRFGDEGLESHVYYLGYFGNMDLIVRAEGDPDTLIEPIQEAILELDPGMPAGAVASLDELVTESNAAPRFYALMVGIFAGFALLLTAVGLYGLVAYTVGQRTREIGLRMALGAHKRDITKMALGHAVKSVGWGVVIGVSGSLALANVLRSFLYEMDPVDPLTYGAVVLVLAGVAVGAGYVPAFRASRSSPTEALRYE